MAKHFFEKVAYLGPYSGDVGPRELGAGARRAGDEGETVQE